MPLFNFTLDRSGRLSIFLIFIFSAICVPTKAQQIPYSQDQRMIDKIFEEALVNGDAYHQLDYLCTEIGPRLSGSENAAKAVERTAFVMDSLGFDSVFKQACMVPHWERGNQEKAILYTEKGKESLSICALGGSIATPKKGIKAEIVEVQNFLDLKKLGRENIEGKIVFYNRPMNPVHLYTFAAYSGSVDQRWAGAMRAAEYGAVATITRSLSLKLDDYPHTGSMGYSDTITKIPAVAISTIGAERLHSALKDNPDISLLLEASSSSHSDALSHNVIGELKGTEFPDEILVVGGHLDSWDLGQGAHDDGAGCVQAIEALRILKAIGYTPKRTLRAVMYMNEENGLKGAIKYAELAKENNENHIAAIESDRGGFAPKGFHFEAKPAQHNQLLAWSHLFKEYGIFEFKEGYGGADIGQLRGQGDVVLIGLVPESQRYFDYHHAASDVIEAVNARELHSGAAAMAAMIYLIDKYGIN